MGSPGQKTEAKAVRDVAFSCDDNGVRFLKVAVWSLLSHYKGDVPLRVNVFEGYGGHSPESKKALAEIVGRFPFASLRYVDAEKAVKPYEDVILHRDNSRWNVFTWTPVFTPQLLPDAVGNVIHFDIDMLFNADVSPLFEMDLGDSGAARRGEAAASTGKPCLIACCHEYDRYGENAGKVVWEKGILPPTVERYFNTGTLVFNAAACREARTWEKIVAWYREHYDIADRIEQDAWNALYHDRMRPLPVKWNFHDRAIKNYARWDVRKKYWLGNPPRECLEAALAPAILHFWGPKKPWKVSHRPYRRLYHAAMAAVGQTPPKEPLLAPYHNLVNRLNLWTIRNRLAFRHPFRRMVKHAVKGVVLTPFEWLGIGVALAVLANLPHRALFAVCDALSAVMYRFDGHGRRLSLVNLRIARGMRPLDPAHPVRFDPEKAPYDPTKAEEKVIRRAYRNMARTVGHAFWTCRNGKARAASVGEMSPRAKAFLAAHRPAVTVSAHIGCWELLSQQALLEGHSMMSVAKDIGTRGMTRLLMWARRSIGQEIVPAEGAFRPLMAGIKAGKSLGLLVDQFVDPRDGGVWVRFFGRPMCVSAAPAFFAAKAKAPIIVAWSRPLKDGRYRCEYADDISAAEAKDVWRTTQRCTRALERIIRRHPSCWVMNYDFFKLYPRPHELETLCKREAETA